MSVNKAGNKINKTLLTPCRQVGLKRKSLGSTPRNFNTPSPSVLNTSLNSSASVSRVNTDLNITPVRHKIGDTSVTQSEKKIKLDLLKNKNIFAELSDEKEENYENLTEEELELQMKQLEKSIAEKQIKINDLKLDSVNAKQHDLNTLNGLIKKWRSGCQAALKELLNEYQSQGKNCTMPLLLQSLGIPSELVHFSHKEMDFTD